MKGITYLVSDTKDMDLPVFVSDSIAEIAALFGTTRGCISSQITKKQKLRGRYLIERISLLDDLSENRSVNAYA